MSESLLEVCVDDADGLAAAIEGGADRIELCSALAVGGLTPSAGLMRRAASASPPVYAMVRPRDGGFVFGAADLDVMLRDIEAVRDAGLAGVVLGASRPDGTLDVEMLRHLVRAAEGLGRTLHRCFDLVPHVAEAIEVAAALGFERVLTSGGAPRAVDGAARLRAAHEAARDRLIVMPGSGVTVDNVGALAAVLPLREIHASCSIPAEATDRHARSFGFSGGRRTSREAVAALKAACRTLSR